MRSAVRQKAVRDSNCRAIAHIVAIALVHLLVVKGLGISDPNLRAFAARDRQQRIRRRQRLAIQQDVNVAPSGHGHWRGGKTLKL